MHMNALPPVIVDGLLFNIVTMHMCPLVWTQQARGQGWRSTRRGSEYAFKAFLARLPSDTDEKWIERLDSANRCDVTRSIDY